MTHATEWGESTWGSSVWGGGGDQLSYDNWGYWAQQHGRRLACLLYLDGIRDPICTLTPPDKKLEPYSLVHASGDYSATPSSTSHLVVADGTFGAYAKPGTHPGGDVEYGLCVWEEQTEGWGYALVCRRSAADNYLRLYVGDDAGGWTAHDASEGFYPAEGSWSFVAVTFGGSSGLEIGFYIAEIGSDGSLTERYEVVSTSTPPSRAARDGWGFAGKYLLGGVADGSVDAGTESTWVGSLAGGCVYSRALTRSELRRVLYRQVDSKWTVYPWLRAQWSMREGAGTLVRDTSGHSYHLTLGDGVGAQEPTWSTDDSPYSVTYREIMSAPSAIGQDVDLQAQTSTISGIKATILDTDDWLTAALAGISYAIRQRGALLFVGFDGLLESEYKSALVGSIQSLQPLAGRGYEIKVGDAKYGAKKRFQLGTAQLDGAINNAVTTITLTTLYGFAGRSVGAGAPDGYVRIDDEIIRYQGVDPTTLQLTSCTRGALGTSNVAHDDAADVNEIYADRDTHPIDMMLRLLCSSSGNDAADSGYDTLARYDFAGTQAAVTVDGRGAGLAPSEIDIPQIIEQKTLYWSSGFDGSLIVDEDIDDLKEWCEKNILRPLGAFFFSAADGRLRVGTWNDRAGSSPVITQLNQSRPMLSVSLDRILNSIRYRYHRDIVANEYGHIAQYENVDSGVAHGRSTALKIDSPWIRDDDFGGTTFTPATITALAQSLYFARFAGPVRIVETTVGLEHYDRDVDSVAILSHAHLPDLDDGVRGIQGEDWQIIGRRVDLRRGRIIYRLARMPQ